MKIIGTNKEFDFIKEAVINFDFQCEDCPFAEFCDLNKEVCPNCSELVWDAIDKEIVKED